MKQSPILLFHTVLSFSVFYCHFQKTNHVNSVSLAYPILCPNCLSSTDQQWHKRAPFFPLSFWKYEWLKQIEQMERGSEMLASQKQRINQEKYPKRCTCSSGISVSLGGRTPRVLTWERWLTHDSSSQRQWRLVQD